MSISPEIQYFSVTERNIIHTRDEEGLAGSIGELAPKEIDFLNSVKS